MAVNAEQVSRLDNLHDRGIKNEVPGLKVVGPDEIRDIEPNCVVGNVRRSLPSYDSELRTDLFYKTGARFTKNLMPDL